MVEDTFKQERLTAEFARGVEQLIAEVHRLSAAGEKEKMAELLATSQYSHAAIKEMVHRGEWQKFTEASRRIILWGQEEAVKRNCPYVETEHLLLALAREIESYAAQLLKEKHVTYHLVQQEIDAGQVAGGNRVRHETANSGAPTGQAPVLSDQAKHVLEYAAEEAKRIAQKLRVPGDIYPEHLLLGLLHEGDGLACRVLQKAGFDLESARDQVTEHWRVRARA